MNIAKNYLAAQVQSATPTGLIVMLYDGLLRFAAEAAEELKGGYEKRSARSSERVDRCLRILTELTASLKHDVDPKFCNNLSSLYSFFTNQLSIALREYRDEPIRQIIPLIEVLRDSWKEVDAGKVEEGNAMVA